MKIKKTLIKKSKKQHLINLFIKKGLKINKIRKQMIRKV